MRELLRLLAAGLALAALVGAAVPGEAWVAARRTRGMGLARGYAGAPVYLPYWSGRDLWCLEHRYLDRRTQERGRQQQDPERAKRLAEECGSEQGTRRR